MENRECPYIEKCPMFKEFKIDATREYFIKEFCRGSFNKCERKKMRDSGKMPPDKMLPTGKILPA